MLSRSLLALTALASVVSAHFHLVYPVSRIGDDDSEPEFPCGGLPQSSNRTVVSPAGFPLALQMGHDRVAFQVLLAVGSDPGSNFNITLEQTFQQIGEGDFCLPSVKVPSGVNIPSGSNGTIQVITSGEGGGGLFVVSVLSPNLQTVADPVPVCRCHF